MMLILNLEVSKLFRAYGLYNTEKMYSDVNVKYEFQSSFELTGYITVVRMRYKKLVMLVSKLFRAYGLYNAMLWARSSARKLVSKLFRAYGLYNSLTSIIIHEVHYLFQSSFELTGYITGAILDRAAIEEIGFKALSSLRVI